MTDVVGWVATAIFAASYFVRRPAVLRGVQASAALCWIAYGVLVHSIPVIVANVIVASLAAFTAWRTPSPTRAHRGPKQTSG